jgi:DNA-binding NtrC family response regulator
VTALRPSLPTILVVDDESSVRRFASRVLVEEGFGVEEATDGLEALTLARGGAHTFDAVLSDIVMPRLNGVQLLQELTLSHPTLPVVLMSGYAAAQLETMGITPPCGMLIKPFSAEQLVGEVRRCLRGADPLAVSGSGG